MPDLTLLIKSSSSLCNMDCTYCFYKDVAKNRDKEFLGPMTTASLEKLLISAMDYAENSCTFMFQGGEPTLSGIDFFREFIDLQNKHKKKNVTIYNCIQTNGFDIDENFAKFLSKHNFLVGLSLDGPAAIHNLNRKDNKKNSSFNRVMKTAALFNRYNVKYNVLSVITRYSAKRAEKIYNFYKNNGFHNLQFIPCLEPISLERGKQPYSLSNKDYTEFLIRIFDLWYSDFKSGLYINIRHLDNWFSILLGQNPESCGMMGRCSIQFVVEGDGSVYPCDFYAFDEYRLGKIGENSFSEMYNCDTAKNFINRSLHIPEECKACKYYFLCRNGCYRQRNIENSKNSGKYYYCEALKEFFEKRKEQIIEACSLIRHGFIKK